MRSALIRSVFQRLFGRFADPAIPPRDGHDIIAASPLFSASWYLDRNPDVRAAGIDPALHYFLHGAAEGRDPSPRFSTSGYLAANPDVESSGMNPLLHYVLHGAADKRVPGPSTEVTQEWRGAGPVPASPMQTVPAAAKQDYQKKLVLQFETFLLSNGRISIAGSRKAVLSVIIVLHNRAHFSYACLRSIEDAARSRDDVELIVVDSGSTDRTGELLGRVDGAAVTRFAENLGFLKSVNLAVSSCAGEYIVLLNNDAVLRPGALDRAVETISEDTAVGAVGAKIMLPNGFLQEAGCILWSDGTGTGYGRGHSPSAGPYMFRRDVAFCSGAFLLIRKSLFVGLGGFDERFAPAYYEETDLSVRLREAGHRIVYDPRVEILHYEFGSAQSSENALQLQQRNHGAFIEKHGTFLARCPVRDPANLLSARSVEKPRKRILILDDHVPYPELGVGFPRARDILNFVHSQGHFVTFVPLESPSDDWRTLRRVIPHEVEVLLGVSAGQLGPLLSERSGYYDLIFVSRPNNMRTLLSALQAAPALMRIVPILYDAEALWTSREVLRRAGLGSPMPADEQERMLEEEVCLARAAAHVTAVNQNEADIFRKKGCASVRVVSQGWTLSPTPKPHSERENLLFIGSLDDDPSPNADALIWFANEMLPLIRKELGRPIRLIVAGRCGAPRVRALASPDIVLLGEVPDLGSLYNEARVFIAPHRYAAGIPTKVLDAAVRGLPCATSDLLASQLRWRHGVELLSAGTAQEFARCVCDLYADARLWAAVRDGALQTMERDYSKQGFRDALAASLNEALKVSERAR